MKRARLLARLQARLLATILILGLMIGASTTQAHSTQQARIIHVLLYQNHIEVYINLLLPQSPKVTFWQRLFDHNHNHRLESKERYQLGLYLKHYAEKGLQLTFMEKKVRLRFVTLQNSHLRGDARRKRYSWDIRLNGKLSPSATWPKGTHKLQVKIRPLFLQEEVPVAVVAIKNISLQRTTMSYILRRNQKDRAVCKMSIKRPFCDFLLQQKKATKKPTSRSSKK